MIMVIMKNMKRINKICEKVDNVSVFIIICGEIINKYYNQKIMMKINIKS